MTPDVDLTAFAHDIEALEEEVRDEVGPDDLTHMLKLERWGRLCTLLGLAVAWLAPNPLSALLISQGTFSRWAIIAHHTLHRGMDKVPGTPARLTSRGFAKGWRRLLDWPDWIHPDAWSYEHNYLHHYKLGEAHDPDQPELNLDFLRTSPLPQPLRYALVAFFALTWKWLYYAPNTTGEYHNKEAGLKKAQGERLDLLSLSVWSPLHPQGRKLWLRSWLPYATLQFGLLPLPFLLLGTWAWASVLINLLLAELLTNLHAFAVIVPNHAGDDVYRFTTPSVGKPAFYLRQVIGSVNYSCGHDLVDFLHGYLNYQIEHHLWPDLPPAAYKRAQPRVKALCEAHGVPYVQEPIWRRVRQLVGIMVGTRTMPVWPDSAPTPEASEALA